MELSRYLHIVRRRLLLILVCPILAAGSAAIVSLLLPPVYEAHVSVYVKLAQPLAASDPSGVSLTSDQVLRTYASLVTEPTLLYKAGSQLGLNMRPEDLAKEVHATPVPNTTKLDVAVQDTNPALATSLANQLVTDLIAQVNDFQRKAAQNPNSPASDYLVVVSPAVLPDRPLSPNIPLNIALAFAAGLLAALGLAFVLDSFDQSIKSDAELTERLGLFVLSHIGYAPSSRGRRGELVTLDPQSHAAESYNALRTAVLFSGLDQELKEIVITSPGPGEGKSRTAANFAIALANAGHKTLLVDADFRRPSQHRIFGRIRNIGLSNLILQDVGENDAITVVDGMPDLWLLTSGPTPPNPSELLGSGRMRELMSRLRTAFTFIVVDTPPVNAVTDALILAASANATVLVIEQGRTTFPALGRAKQLLERVGAHTIGAVMNKVRTSSGAYSYDYGYYATDPQGSRAGRNTGQSSEPSAG
jgi:capsular exopolysaccharide synthesis family protein